MAKRTVSFDDYKEPTWEQYTGEEPPPNRWFTAVAKRGWYDSEAEQMVFICEIAEGDFKGWGKGWYAPFEGSLKWKLQEFIRAVTGKTQAVSLDWENEKAVENWLKKAKPFRIRTEEYKDRISIRTMSPLLSAVPAGTDAPDVAPEPEVSDGDDEPYTEAELLEMSAEDLEGILIEDFEVPEEELPAKPRRDPKGSKYIAALAEAILEEQEAEGDDDPAPEEGEDGFDDGFDDADDNGTEADPEPEPEPDPTPAARGRRTAARAGRAAPAKATPAAPATTTRRRRG